jgi:threonine dehydrogenase-like Zn-dependent dehydrogenase
VTTFATDHLPLEQAPHGDEMFRDEADGCIKVILRPLAWFNSARRLYYFR